MGKRHHLRRTTHPFSRRQLARMACNGALGRLVELVNISLTLDEKFVNDVRSDNITAAGRSHVMRRHETLFAGAIFAIVAISGQAAAQVTSATVNGGRVEGLASSDIGVFKGIPFSAPPVGDKRWKMPQSVVPWTGVKKVDAYAPGCM